MGTEARSSAAPAGGNPIRTPSRGKLLVLGGTGFLGQNVCHRAIQAGYSPVSLSRRGIPASDAVPTVDYRTGDAREKKVVSDILNESSEFVGVVHCIGLLFDHESGLGSWNYHVSGSGSVPDSRSTYDTITRQTTFHAIEAAQEYVQSHATLERIPFCFTSAAEAGWPDVWGGSFLERNLAPQFLRRYLTAKRQVEAKLMSSEPELRPIVVRPSLVYSTDRTLSLPWVGAFIAGNKIGLPFVDKPVTVQNLAQAIVHSIHSKSSTVGVLRYREIDAIATSG